MRIKREDIDRVKKLEEELLSLDVTEHGLRYVPDTEIEIRIKENVLLDNFGPDAVKSAMQKLGIDRKSLSDQNKYILINNYLKGST